MTTIINGSSPSVTFSDGTTQSTAFTTCAVTQSTIATGVAGTGPAFSAYATSNSQSIASGTFTKIQFTAKEFDTANCFDSTTNYRFTPTIAGYYQIDACVGLASNALGICLVSIYKNNARFKDGAIIPNSGGATCPASALIYFNGSTDYVEIYLYQSSGSTLAVSVNAGSAGFFQGALVRAA